MASISAFENASKTSDLLKAAMTACAARIDASRVYVTGHSNGASAALAAAALGIGDAGRRFAACVPVAPGGLREQLLCKLAGTPTWRCCVASPCARYRASA